MTMPTIGFQSFPWGGPKLLRATEARLERIYHSAYAGLKGDSLAVSVGMTPHEYRRLRDNDANVEMAEAKGRADSELEHATNLAEASRGGDSRAALEILKHLHGWVAKQQVEVTTTDISIKAILDERESRLLAAIEGEATRIADASCVVESAQGLGRPAETAPLQRVPDSTLEG